MAHVPVKVLPITDRHHEYARELVKRLQGLDIRVELDARNEKINYKIREAQTQKIPYMLVIGDREMEQGAVAVRERGKGDVGAISVGDFIMKIEDDIQNKML